MGCIDGPFGESSRNGCSISPRPISGMIFDFLIFFLFFSLSLFFFFFFFSFSRFSFFFPPSLSFSLSSLFQHNKKGVSSFLSRFERTKQKKKPDKKKVLFFQLKKKLWEFGKKKNSIILQKCLLISKAISNHSSPPTPPPPNPTLFSQTPKPPIQILPPKKK